MQNSALNRRLWLKQAAAGTAAVGIGTSSVVPTCFQQIAAASEPDSGQILVVVQLSGGNDGLNTLVPFKDDAYKAARPKLSIGADDVLKLNDEYGLHPALSGFNELLQAGKASIIQGVGYPNPNRSHFESMDIWHTCFRKDQRTEEGWIGRYLQSQGVDQSGDAPAMHLGNKAQPLALASRDLTIPTVKSLKGFQLRGDDAAVVSQLLSNQSMQAQAAPSPQAESSLLGFLNSSTANAIAASERISSAIKDYETPVDYPESGLGAKLKMVAQLITSQLSTRVYYVELDGFDTHAKQADSHAALLRQYSEAVTAFMKDLKHHQLSQQVCVLTFSEFGRRVAENASEGTDHGAAGLMMLCGESIKPGLLGQKADLTDLQEGDLKHQIDFRTVYAGIIQDWLGGDPAKALGASYEPMKLFA